MAGLALHPRSAVQRHKGTPDYALVRELVEELPVPVIVSGGLSDAGASRRAWEETGADALMLARGSLGNPWLFARLLGQPRGRADRDEVLDELDWVVDRAVEHLGEERAARYLRKFYPWYVERLGAGREVQDALQRADSLATGTCRARRIATPQGRLNSALYFRALRDTSRRTPPAHPAGFRSEKVMPKDVILTPDGLVKLKSELEELQGPKRREVAARIKEAREFGDIMENSEYDDAKNEQAMLEAKIAQLEDKLRSASVIDASELSTDEVRVGTTVHVKDEKTGKSVKYAIVGSAEANPVGEQALQRVARRPRAHRPQARRDGRGRRAARPQAQAEDHQDRGLRR